MTAGSALHPRSYRITPRRRTAATAIAKEPSIIADQARMCRDLHPFRHRDKTAVDLRILCARRTDLASDRNRAINRLRAQLLEYFPALERAFEFAHRKGALILLTGYQTPSPLWRHLAASKSIKTCPESRNYNDRKRSEDKLHSQAVLCLARRRLNVLWAMHRDNTSYQPGSPRAA